MKIYTDGSYNLELGIAGYGIVIPEHEEKTIFGPVLNAEFNKQRNVAGEITAAIMAVEYAEECGAAELIIYHDYEGIAKWPNKEWKAKNKYTQEYTNFINEKRKTMKISFVHIKGHSGNKYNTMADKAAAKGAQGYLSEESLKPNQPTPKSVASYNLTILDNGEFQFGRVGDLATNYELQREDYKNLSLKSPDELSPIELISLAVFKSQNNK